MVSTFLDSTRKNNLTGWRIGQGAVWGIGVVIFLSLIFLPSFGLLLFWNILIPVAPALLVVSVGLWRNICPLATTTLLPRHLGRSKRKRMSLALQGKLGLVAVMALYLLVPLRHPVFNASGYATAILLLVAAVIGIIMGFFYEWKSAWCSSLCPVHPVEKLYGVNSIVKMRNAHCDRCMKCVTPCPDSTPDVQPHFSDETVFHRLSGWLLIGGLPGFIWGWFQIPDEIPWQNLMAVYQRPLLGMAVTLSLYTLIAGRKPARPWVRKTFAAMSVSCYYWFRIPALFGFGLHGRDGLLIDLSNQTPSWVVTGAVMGLILFFFSWIVFRDPASHSWLIRPGYGKKATPEGVRVRAED